MNKLPEIADRLAAQLGLDRDAQIGDATGERSQSSSLSMINSDAVELRSEYLWHVHSYINEYIRFADGKAGFIVALTSAVLWALLSGQHNAGWSQPIIDWNAKAWLCLLAIGFLCVSVFCAVCAVIPRLLQHPSESFLYWGGIAKHSTSNAFTNSFNSLSPTDLLSQITTHLFTISDIAKKKYRWVTASIVTGAIGTFLGVATFILK